MSQEVNAARFTGHPGVRLLANYLVQCVTCTSSVGEVLMRYTLNECYCHIQGKALRVRLIVSTYPHYQRLTSGWRLHSSCPARQAKRDPCKLLSSLHTQKYIYIICIYCIRVYPLGLTYFSRYQVPAQIAQQMPRGAEIMKNVQCLTDKQRERARKRSWSKTTGCNFDATNAPRRAAWIRVLCDRL